MCRLLACCWIATIAVAAAAEPAPSPGAPAKPTSAAWGVTGLAPQTGSSAHTSGRAFKDESAAHAAPAAAKAESPVSPPAPTIVVKIDKEAQEMTVLVEGVERHVWPVSTGLRAYDTPIGNYTARSMNEIWYSREWDDAPMPHAIFFTRKGHAIHGTEDRKKLGRPASHGCVRLAPENARTLFALVKRHGLAKTAIVLSGELPRAEAKAAPKPAAAKPAKAADKKKPDAKPSHARAKAKPEQAAKRRAAEKTQEEKKPKAAKRQASPPKQAARPRRYDPYAIGPPRRLTRQEWLRLYYGYAPPPPRGYYGPPPRRYWRDY